MDEEKKAVLVTVATINWNPDLFALHRRGLVAFRVIPPLHHVVREETETNTWSYYPGLLFSKDQTFSTTRAVSVSSGKDNSNAAAAA